MSRATSRSRRRRGSASRVALGALTALVFNASLIALPFMAAALHQTLSSGDLIDYTPTAATKASTLNALNAEAARFVRPGEDRRLTWNNLIARELGEGDVAAARGFVLTAPALLRGADAAQIQRTMKPGGDEGAYVEAALPLIEPAYMRPRVRGLIKKGDAKAFDVLGDARETADAAMRWRAGESIDYMLFALGGATLGAPGDEIDDVRLGASVLKTAKNKASLTPEFAASFDAKVAAAIPSERLRSELDSIFQNRENIVDEGAAAALAFTRARDPQAWSALADDLRLIGETARAASPAGAAQLLKHVRVSRDLVRLRLVAEAGGERAVAIGKRTPDRLVLKSARGAVRWTDRLIGDIGWTLLTLLGFVLSTYAAVFGAVRRAWDGPGESGDEQPPSPAPAGRLSKAEAVKRARQAAAATGRAPRVDA